jgi:hypothetical protein
MGDIPATSSDQTGESSQQADRDFRPLRVWPAVLLVAAMLGVRLLPGLLEGNPTVLMMVAAMGPLILGGLIMIWWLVFSRATVSERIIGFLGTIAVATVVFALSDKSMRGPGTMIMAIPFGTGAFALGAILFSQTLPLKRTVVAILLGACGFGVTALMRSDGMWGNAELQWYWRWESSDEERMLADRGNRSAEVKTAVMANDFDAWLAGRAGLLFLWQAMRCIPKSSAGRMKRWFATRQIRVKRFGRSNSSHGSKKQWAGLVLERRPRSRRVDFSLKVPLGNSSVSIQRPETSSG